MKILLDGRRIYILAGQPFTAEPTIETARQAKLHEARMSCVAVLVQALGMCFQRRSQRPACQSLNCSWVGAVIEEIVEWSLHSTSIHSQGLRGLCRVLSAETGENAGAVAFARHSPELGIVCQRVDGDSLGKMRTQAGVAAGNLQRSGGKMPASAPAGE